MAEEDLDLGTKMHAFTTKNYRDVYPGIDPARPEHAQTGKVIVITGASRGLGRLVRRLPLSCSSHLTNDRASQHPSQKRGQQQSSSSADQKTVS